MTENLPAPAHEPLGQVILYQTEDGSTRIDVRLEDETAWLTQAAMAELFQTTPQNITIHIRGIYNDGELREAATCKQYLQVRQEGARRIERALKHYNLDVILAVGLRAGACECQVALLAWWGTVGLWERQLLGEPSWRSPSINSCSSFSRAASCRPARSLR